MDEQGPVFSPDLAFLGIRKLTAEQKKGLIEIILAYFRAWFDAPVSVSAPANILAFLKNLNADASINSDVSRVACTKFLNHLWYLSEEVVAFAFFGDCFAEERKQRMVRNLVKPGKSSRTVKSNMKMEEIEANEIEDFVSVKSLQFFKAQFVDRFLVIATVRVAVK